jgi:hypothetical protein
MIQVEIPENLVLVDEATLLRMLRYVEARFVTAYEQDADIEELLSSARDDRRIRAELVSRRARREGEDVR